MAYDKSAQRLIVFERLPSGHRLEADKRRSELEVQNRDRVREVEIVVLEAPSKKALLRTHSRYFRSATELLQLMQTNTARRKQPRRTGPAPKGRSKPDPAR